MNLRIARWSGQAGVADILAAWHVREWGHLFPDWDEHAARAELLEQSQTESLPATWLAFDGDVLIGSISALLEDAAELNDIPGPWLASFYIVPEARGQGAAQALMAAAAEGVAAQGHGRWVLFTPHHEAYYAKHGWSTQEYRELHGERLAVMTRALDCVINSA